VDGGNKRPYTIRAAQRFATTRQAGSVSPWLRLPAVWYRVVAASMSLTAACRIEGTAGVGFGSSLGATRHQPNAPRLLTSLLARG
jgi:hypothetical protein